MKILVVGAGQMGAGIAQVCATFEHALLLHDVDDARIAHGFDGIGKLLDRDVAKERRSGAEREAIVGRIEALPVLDDAPRPQRVIGMRFMNPVPVMKLVVLHAGFGDSKYRACPLLRQYVAAGWSR